MPIDFKLFFLGPLDKKLYLWIIISLKSFFNMAVYTFYSFCFFYHIYLCDNHSDVIFFFKCTMLLLNTKKIHHIRLHTVYISIYILKYFK